MSNMDHDEGFQPMTEDQIADLQDDEFTRLVNLNRELILALIDIKEQMGSPEWTKLKRATVDILISISLGGITPIISEHSGGENIG
jgi:hypothetical protein